jgi:hypothetical protein
MQTGPLGITFIGFAVERQVDRSDLVLYAEDSMPNALLWPIGVLALSPVALDR